MESNLGYVTHRKKLLDFIITDLKQSFGDKYTQLTKDYSIQNALEDFFAAVQVFWGQIRDEIGDRHWNKV